MSEAVPVEAYRATDFAVLHGGREVIARVGERSPELDVLLAELGAESGVFITAWNPRSEPQPDDVNAAANVRMAARFAGRGVRALPHVGRAPDGNWAEDGFFALDLPLPEALTLARAFGQFAVAFAPQGGALELHLTGV